MRSLLVLALLAACSGEGVKSPPGRDQTKTDTQSLATELQTAKARIQELTTIVDAYDKRFQALTAELGEAKTPIAILEGSVRNRDAELQRQSAELAELRTTHDEERDIVEAAKRKERVEQAARVRQKEGEATKGIRIPFRKLALDPAAYVGKVVIVDCELDELTKIPKWDSVMPVPGGEWSLMGKARSDRLPWFFWIPEHCRSVHQYFVDNVSGFAEVKARIRSHKDAFGHDVAYAEILHVGILSQEAFLKAPSSQAQKPRKASDYIKILK